MQFANHSIRRMYIQFSCAAALLCAPHLHAQNIVLEAESATIVNADAANDVQNSVQTGNPEVPARGWSIVSDAGASGGQCLRASASPDKQTATATLQESLAQYDVTFASAGSYYIYLRARNDGGASDGSTDSIWIPNALGDQQPSVSQNVPKNSNYDWVQSASQLTVTAGDVGVLRSIYIGVREPLARIDGILLSKDDLDSVELDQAFGVGYPTPTWTPVPSPTPDGSSTCTVSNVSQFNSALTSAMPGSTIIMCNGTYNNVELEFYGSKSANGTGGTSTQPITLRAQNPGGVRITGESYLRIDGNYMVVEGILFTQCFSDGAELIVFRRDSNRLAHNCTLRNSAMINCNPANPNVDYKWVSIYGTENAIEDCTFSQRRHPGVTVTIWPQAGGPPNATRIEGCHFADRDPGDGNGFETIRIGTSDVSQEASNAMIRGNLFQNLDGEIEVVSNKSIGNQYIANTFRNCQGQLALRHGGACRVEGNFFFGEGKSGSSGVRIIGPDHVVINNYFQDLDGTLLRAAIAVMNGVPGSPLDRYLPVVNATIANNTIVNCKQPFAIGTVSSEGDTTVAPSDSKIVNNAVLGAQNNLITIVTTPQNFTWAGNVMQGPALGYSGAASGTTLTDPQLTPGSDGLYRPLGTSPLIDSATADFIVSTDMDGQPRNDGANDIGADEVSAQPITYHPLNPEDVGALWLRPQQAGTQSLTWAIY